MLACELGDQAAVEEVGLVGAAGGHVPAGVVVDLTRGTGRTGCCWMRDWLEHQATSRGRVPLAGTGGTGVEDLSGLKSISSLSLTQSMNSSSRTSVWLRASRLNVELVGEMVRAGSSGTRSGHSSLLLS